MKTSNVSSQGGTWQRGYGIGALLFLGGVFSLFYYNQTENFFGYMLVAVSLLVLWLNAWTISTKKFGSKFFSIGSGLLFVSLILVCDLIDEVFHHLGWSGNGFLLDGISMILYFAIVPVFTLAGTILLIKDSKNSTK